MAEIGIFAGTMYGNSLLVAEEAKRSARQGHSATVFEDPELSDWQQQYQDKVALVVTSTTGHDHR